MLHFPACTLIWHSATSETIRMAATMLLYGTEERVSLWPHFEADSRQPFFLCCFIIRKTIDTAQCKSYRNQHHLCLEWFPLSLVFSMLFKLPLIFSQKKKGLISRTKEERPPSLNINRSWHFLLCQYPHVTVEQMELEHGTQYSIPPQWANSVLKLRSTVRNIYTCLNFHLNIYK